jgi:hypothetical protein
MRPHFPRIWVLAGLLVLAPPRTVLSTEKATLAVANQNALDVDISVMVNGKRIRVGTVITGHSAVFDLPNEALSASGVRLVADAVGSRESYTSASFVLHDGQQVKMVITTRITQSSWSMT